MFYGTDATEYIVAKANIFIEDTIMKSLFEQMSDTYRKENGYLAVIDKQVEDMFLLLVKNIRN